ncbi:MAG TPA: ABC transporter substrate-binding protein, partial [Bauldia sp.]|nr:ABC transporter substrate-binding protein [Bauldia sp.]
MAVTLVGISGHFGLAARAESEALTRPPTLTVCHALTIDLLTAVAEAEGEFAGEGLNVVLFPFATGRDALAAMLEGKCDLATVDETPLVLTAFERNDLRIIATTRTTRDLDRIAARKAAGISTVDDLRGKRVGVIPRTPSPYFLNRLLLANGIDRADVTALPFASPPALVSALIRGEVDAIALWP